MERESLCARVCAGETGSSWMCGESEFLPTHSTKAAHAPWPEAVFVCLDVGHALNPYPLDSLCLIIFLYNVSVVFNS